VDSRGRQEVTTSVQSQATQGLIADVAVFDKRAGMLDNGTTKIKSSNLKACMDESGATTGTVEHSREEDGHTRLGKYLGAEQVAEQEVLRWGALH
jgi:hypothetical protein